VKRLAYLAFHLSWSGWRSGAAASSGGMTGDTTVLDFYRDDRLKLDELVTTRYRLDEVNQGYQDLRDGRTSAA
jgi:Zn-dependent alcohol dehydrogenase